MYIFFIYIYRNFLCIFYGNAIIYEFHEKTLKIALHIDLQTFYGQNIMQH